MRGGLCTTMLGIQRTLQMQAKRKGCRVLCAALRALLRTVHSEPTYAVPPTCGDVVEPSRVPTLPRRSKISELRPRITLGHMLGHFFWMRLCMLFMAALALALSMRGGKHSNQYRLPNSGAPPSNRSVSAAVLRYRYNQRPRVNAVASALEKRYSCSRRSPQLSSPNRRRPHHPGPKVKSWMVGAAFHIGQTARFNQSWFRSAFRRPTCWVKSAASACRAPGWLHATMQGLSMQIVRKGRLWGVCA